MDKEAKIDIPKNKECKFDYEVATFECCYLCSSPMVKKITNKGERYKTNYASIYCINEECSNR